MNHDNSPGAQTASGIRLWVPQITSEMDVLDAARAYANAGWYVVPIRRGTKHPGSVVGDGWQRKSSRNNEQLEEWWARTDYGIALHVGRSGALVFDVDVPGNMPELLSTALERDTPPYQSTRTDVPGKGHYVYAAPPQTNYGNSPGHLGLQWGEVRGKNGIIVVAPSAHERADEGGHYAWQRVGTVPELPPELAAQLPETGDASEAATDDEVRMFADTYTAELNRGLLIPVIQRFDNELRDGGSRHGAMITAACWAAREAAAGGYPAGKAQGQLRRKFIEVMRRSRLGSDRALTENQAAAEFDGIWAWAVSQAVVADLEAVRERIEARQYRPERGLGFDPPPAPRTDAIPDGQPGDDTEDEIRSSWLPVDLSTYLDGSYTPPTAGILHRSDGQGLLYAGKVHWMHGESESGKSWAAQIAALQVMDDGGEVVYLDHESDPVEVTGRFRSLGMAPAEIAKLLTYIQPDSSAYAEDNYEAWQGLLERRPVLVIIDGVTDALGLDRVSSKDTDEVAKWVRHMPRKLAKATGAAVVCIDHVTKDPDERGRYMIGSQAKMNGIDGAAFLVEPGGEPIGRGITGEIVLRVAKDRPGTLRGTAGVFRRSDRTQEIARISLDASNPDALEVSVNGPTREDTELEAWIKHQALSAMGTEYSSANRLLEAARDDGVKFKQSPTIKRDSMDLYRQWCERRVAFDPGSGDGSES